MGMVFHALSGDASRLPFSDNAAAERWFHHARVFAWECRIPLRAQCDGAFQPLSTSI